MLYQMGHGAKVTYGAKTRGASGLKADDTVPIGQVCSISKTREMKPGYKYPVPTPNPDPTTPGLEPREVFRFYFKTAPEVAPSADAAAKLDALATAMAEANFDQKDEEGESSMPPIFTYLGQFIDHDMTANTDREEGDPLLSGFNIDKATLNPQPRDDVEKSKMNLRKGLLELDSVYGDGPGQSAEAEKLEAALRDPTDLAKMRIGAVTPLPPGLFEVSDFPADSGADLPRVGQAIDDGSLTMADVRTLFDNPSEPKSDEELRRVALIGDGRNEENLIVAQTHLSMLRFHNAVVDAIRAAGNAPGDDDALFAEARQNVTWIYQWLVVNHFLKTICDGSVVDTVVADKAPVYSGFFDKHKGSVPEGARPMPLEFSVAAYRYGHSMVRGDYDYNSNFGRKADGSGTGRASFGQIFEFTAGGGMMGLPTLPDNWIIDWNRFIDDSGTFTNRVARKIDTRLALPLRDMRNEKAGMSGIMAHLAARNLRRGYVFNLPDAQSIMDSMASDGITVDALTAAELSEGTTGDAVLSGQFEVSTPLWFYLLKEAEVKANGEHLGPLGSRIVAETIAGLIITDPNSYINQGAFNSWTPADAVQPNGEPVESLAALLRAGGLLPSVGV
ncbi:peroxidase family protein [Actibacterium lipolyticum]|uniref:Animal heme peroxidase n=1 Tax=Actibacterium lipolyticum TaxID=1524263 RepID=A0A238KQL5_9RHOB|nr:heme peroxidase family protein [Actibacterium lipolyticum]SMX44422.1 Animal heme peroxidase [Actibacterium lipolyticum]